MFSQPISKQNICLFLKNIVFLPKKEMQLFYHENLSPESNLILLDKEESTHIHRVLRRKIGDLLYITDGRGNLYEGVIQDINDKKCSIVIQSCTLTPPLPYQLHLAVAPTKMNERYEWFLEKVTEIGVHEITPIICEHSERKTVKIERFEKIILSAMKQSLQCFRPILNKPINMLNWLDNNIHEKNRFIAHCQEGKKELLFDKLSTSYHNNIRDILIIIGPEGDFSEKEIQKAIQKNFSPVILSSNRLRTETAAIVACSSTADAFGVKK